MRIAYLVPSICAAGPEIFTKNLLKGLGTKYDVQYDIFYFKDSDRLLKKLGRLEFPKTCIKLSLNKRYNFSNYDIIHSTGFYPDFYVAIHKLYLTNKCVTGIHNFMKEDLKQLHGFLISRIECILWKYSMNKINDIVVSSFEQEKYYRSYLSNNHKFHLINYGIPLPKPRAIDKSTKEVILDLKSKYELLVSCGVLIKRKGFYQMVNYLEHNQNAAVVLIGDGECKQELINLGKELNVSDRFLILGYRKESFNYYPYFDAFCMCSNSEGFGLAMLEAMALSLPLVCSNLAIYKDFFNNDSVGLFEFGDQIGFNNAVDKVLLNKEYFSKKSRELFENYFSIEKMSNKHYEVYKSLISDYFI